MTGKNGNHPAGVPDPVGDSVEKVLRLYDRIKQAAQDSVKRESVPLFGETVYVHTLSADDRDEFESWAARRGQEAKDRGEEPNVRGIRAKALVLGVTDEAGNRLFTEDDTGWLGRSHAGEIDRVFTVIDRLSGLTAGTQADVRKNSPATPEPGVAGPIPSPTNSAKPAANSSATSTPTS